MIESKACSVMKFQKKRTWLIELGCFWFVAGVSVIYMSIRIVPKTNIRKNTLLINTFQKLVLIAPIFELEEKLIIQEPYPMSSKRKEDFLFSKS